MRISNKCLLICFVALILIAITLVFFGYRLSAMTLFFVAAPLALAYGDNKRKAKGDFHYKDNIYSKLLIVELVISILIFIVVFVIETIR